MLENQVNLWVKLESDSFLAGEEKAGIENRIDGNGSTGTTANVRQYRFYWATI